VPTKHPRIAVTRDPELDAALKAAAPILGRSKPASALVRELALRGAKAVVDEDPRSELDRWLDERGGVRRATMSTKEALALAEKIRAGIPRGGPSSEDILADLREDRV
jgi:hypothetical protein